MALSGTLFAVVVGLTILWSLLDKWRSHVQRRPPSPFKLPIFGHLIYLIPSIMDPIKLKIKWKFAVDLMNKHHKPPYLISHNLSKEYGPLMNLKFGVNNSIVVSSAEYAREMLCREEFVDRFTDGWMLDRQFGQQLGLIFNNGRPYREIKHFTVKNLKDFGFGKKQCLETAVEDELVDFLHYFQHDIMQDSTDATLSIHHMFTLPVLNILWKMVAGIRFNYDDEYLHGLICTVEEITKTHDIGGNILMAFPFLRFLFPEITGHSHQLRLYSKLHQFFRDTLNNRMEDCDLDTDNPRDFTEIFIQEMARRQKEYGEKSKIFTEEQFIMVCLDLFTAGAETTANTLDFAMMYLMLNPRVQKNIQKEIDEVLGSRLPRLKDRQSMPYTEAVLLETQRMCNVIPLVHRVSIQDTTLGPYYIQKGDVMVMNTYSIHMDEKVWGDPYVFRPERFLDKNGNINNQASFMPFGMGKRVCIGETLARHTMFTFVTAVMQRYTLYPSEKHDIPKIKPAKGYTLNPEPFHTYISLRN